ncbi:PulJ/GspJ family protein [Mucilaginibacter sp. McL0603]|uniref:PulJ/GspJ family protein n=1 Tax=Mucilaginibacter sp. McL0603 TaxID=3415670 RepID=UPI003CE68391
MAGVKFVYPGKIRASTLIEVIVAMVIIVLVFGMAMMIFTNVTRMSLSVSKIQAGALLNERLIGVEKAKHKLDQSIDTAGFHIELDVTPFVDDTLLNVVHLTAYDLNQHKVAELQKLIIK